MASNTVKITLKFLSGASQTVEVNPHDSIKSLRDKVNAKALAYLGKVLKDEDTIAAAGIKGFIVVIPHSQKKTSKTAINQPKSSEAPAHQSPAAQSAPTSSCSETLPDQEGLTQLLQLGFDADISRTALVFSGGNIELAADMLMRGQIRADTQTAPLLDEEYNSEVENGQNGLDYTSQEQLNQVHVAIPVD